MSIAHVNNQKLAFSDTGEGKPALIFSHGFLMDRTMFDSQVAYLSDSYRCVAWDERGFGETPVTESFTYWDSADDVVALMDHLDIEKAVLLGMSQGGFLSMRAALKYPDRVRALVLIDSGTHVDPPEVLEGYSQMMAHWMSDAPLGEVGDAVAQIIIDEPELMKKWVSIWESRDRYSLKYPSETLITRDHIDDRVSEITCPVLVVHGDNDQAIPIETAEVLSAKLPNCRGLVRVPGAAHAANMTHPDIVNPAILEFLTELG